MWQSPLKYVTSVVTSVLLQAITAAVCDELEDFPLDGGNDDLANNDDDTTNSTTDEAGEMPISDLDMDNEPSEDSAYVLL